MSGWLAAKARLWFRRVVDLYPRDFRDLLGEDMCRTFETKSDRSFTTGGAFAGSLFAVRSLATALFGAFGERLQERRRPRRERRSLGGATHAVEAMASDVTHCARSLRNSAGFAATAVVTLGLGIGVNATLFSLVNTILFSELPARDPDRFAWIWAVNDEEGKDRARVSLREFVELRSESEALSDVAVILPESFVIGDGDDVRRIKAARVSDNYHDAWGVETLVGRGFERGEELPGAAPVAILSHGFWERHFGADPDVLGTSLALDGHRHTIVGVLSPRMEFGDLSTIDVWVPLGLDAATAPVDERPAFLQARLAPGVSVEAAGDEVAAFAARISADYPASHAGWTLRLSLMTEELVNEEDAVLLLVAGLSVAFVLLIACANVANMLMAKASAREKELAVRLAMGASRSRLMRQLLTEGLVLACLGALVGLLFTRLLLDGLVNLTTTSQWLYRNASIDENVLLFTVGIATLTPLLFSFFPSLRATRASVTEALSEGGRSQTARSGMKLRQSLVAAQVAMALVLMIVTGLLVRTVIEMRTMDLGFDSKSVLIATVELPQSSYDAAGQRELHHSLLERVRRHEDVVSASLVDLHPLEPNRPTRALRVPGAATDERRLPSAQFFRAGPDYFRTMRAPLVSGRGFTDADGPDAAKVAVLSETAKSRYWPETDPVGQTFQLGDAGSRESVRIVGVVGDVLDLDGDEASHEPQVYVPFAQWPAPRMVVVARTRGIAEASSGMVRASVAELDPNLRVVVQDLEDVERELFQSSNAIIALFTVFASFALAMSAIGIYGVMAFAVSLRRHEISIRMALGASAGDVVRLIAGQGVRLIAAGGLLGIVAAVVVSQALESVVIGISPRDPWTFATVIVLLGSVALASNYFPARRATFIQPSSALRSD